MAEYFLAKCPSYQKEAGKKLYTRREVVCRHLNENYKAGRSNDTEIFNNVTTELFAKDIRITRSQYQTDKMVLRNAFLYLSCRDDASKNELVAKLASGVMFGIVCLRKDSITSWEELQAAGQSEFSPSIPEPEVSKFSLADHQSGRSVIEAVGVLTTSLEAMLGENELLKNEITRLTELLSDLENRSVDYEDFVKLLEGEIAKLQALLNETNDLVRSGHSANLDRLVALYPDIPELSIAADKLKQQPKRHEEQIKMLLTRLPTTFSWENDSGVTRYEKQFFAELVLLTKDEQKLVIDQVETLTKLGPRYSSLDTKKLTMSMLYSPVGCMQSRVNKSIRFTWKKNGNLVFYWIFRKGDGRVRVSEA